MEPGTGRYKQHTASEWTQIKNGRWDLLTLTDWLTALASSEHVMYIYTQASSVTVKNRQKRKIVFRFYVLQS
jgi:hypothetical protein